MSRESREPNLFDQVMTAFAGYSPGGRVSVVGGQTLFLIERAAAERSGVADIEAAVAALNSGRLSGGIDEVRLVDSVTDPTALHPPAPSAP